ncbi:Voltage-dependent calcium channel type D subunit alpha-1 (DmCa1D) [Durusdinium trenchii]|uniref:Voltage-dependent calcium channel type D subunit alpha-1 (DmCa1D) n=1 Tax=Durusdinium trenchii TaxID=1381693 RepID=A0ABP0IWI5_9DINO
MPDARQYLIPGYHYMELVFLGFYAVELALRLYVHQCFFFFGEAAGWNWFDFFLVAFSFVDVVYLLMQMTTADSTGGSVVPEGNAAGGNVSWMRLFRLFKITKILRTIRIFKVFRELSLMMESFTKCIVAMFWGLVLLVFLLYIFAQLGLCLRDH